MEGIISNYLFFNFLFFLIRFFYFINYITNKFKLRRVKFNCIVQPKKILYGLKIDMKSNLYNLQL